MKKIIKIIDLLVKIANEEELPKKIKYEDKIYIYYEAYAGYYEENQQGIYEKKFLNHRNMQWHSILNDEVEILDEEQEIEIPKEFLDDVNVESEIVLIKEDIGHDYGYKNSIGFTTGRNYIFAFDKRVSRWWECRFEEDEYIRTGLFVSDLIGIEPFKDEEEFEDISELKFSGDGHADYVSMIPIVNKIIKNQKKIIDKLNKE